MTITVESNIPRRAISISEFCRTYGVGRTMVYQLIKDGVLPAIKCGRRTLISWEEAEAWFRNLLKRP